MLDRQHNNLIIKAAISVFFLIAILLFSYTDTYADQITIKVPVATIRKGPSHDFPGIEISKRGDILEVMERKEDWVKVKLPNRSEGWIWDRLTKESDEITKEEASMTEDEATHIALEENEALSFNLKVTKSTVNLRKGPGSSYMWVGTVKKDDLLSGFEEKDGWYQCKTSDGKEGWITSSCCLIVPIHSESVKSEKRRVIVNHEEVAVRAGPDDVYPALWQLKKDQEVGVYLEQEGWLYIKRSSDRIEGWIEENLVFDPGKHIDTIAWKEEVLNTTEKLIHFYDQKKKENRVYQDAGWYPSFSIFLREKDIAIKPLSNGWRLELILSLRKVSMETLFPLPIETIPVSLSKSDRLFFMLLFQTMMENEIYQEIEIRLRGLKKKGGALKWADAGKYMLRKSALEGKDLDKIDPDKFWELLTHEGN